MSPALKQIIQKIAGAGLLFAAAACAADNTATALLPPESGAAITASAVGSVANTAEGNPVQALPQAAVPAANNSVASSTAASVSAYYQNTNANQPKIGSGGHLLNVTLGLLLIIGLIFGLSWFVRRFSHGTFAGNAHLKIIAIMPLGTRERIALIDAGGQQLLVGITPTKINTLHVFDTPVAPRPGDVNNSDFGRKLMAILQRPNTHNESDNKDSGIRG